MATKTDKGTRSNKASSTTSTLSNVTVAVGDSLYCWICSDGTDWPESVNLGNRRMHKVGHRVNNGSSFTVSLWSARQIWKAGTRDIVATWTTATTARNLLAFTLDSPHMRDEIARNIQSASTAPTVGPTPEHLRRDDFITGVLVSEGPSSDTAPTVTGWTAGQSVGTVGSPPVSNLTMREYSQQATTAAGVTLNGTGATSRDWTNIVVALKPVDDKSFDYNLNAIEVGDTVLHNGVEETVVAQVPNFNKVELSVSGVVPAHMLELVE